MICDAIRLVKSGEIFDEIVASRENTIIREARVSLNPDGSFRALINVQ